MTAADPLADVPPPSDRRLAVRVSRDALRQIRGGHPWVFDGSIRSVSHDGDAGDLAVIFDDDRKFAAIGLYDPDSPIRVRIVHTGKPRTIDAAFWNERIADALTRRRSLVADAKTTGYRWVHGENDGLPGLVVDRYDHTAVVKLYTAAWFPHLRDVVAAIVGDAGIGRVVLRTSRQVGDTGPAGMDDGAILVGAAPEDPVAFLEHGLTFEADVVHGQKTGHFLDQRENRRRVGELSAGARVLDVFCCTGGFSVHAAAGGASVVHSVDLSRPAIDTTIRNLAANAGRPAVAGVDHRTTVGDAFEVLASMADRGQRFDVVVIDPPSFASRADQVERALRGYAHLTRLGLAVTRDGGCLVQSSCSSRIDERMFHETIRRSADEAGVRLTEIEHTTHCLLYTSPSPRDS